MLVTVGLKVAEPEMPTKPLHAPEALQAVALVEDQLRVVAPPLVTGVAVRVTVVLLGAWVPRGMIAQFGRLR